MKFKQSENQGTAGQGLLLNYGGLGVWAWVMCTIQAHAQGILQMVVDPSFGNGLLLKFSLGCSHPTVPSVSMVLWVNVPLTTLSV